MAIMKQSASQTVGPFFRIGLIHGQAQNNLVNERTAGHEILVEGSVFDGLGEPVLDAMVEFWQADSNGIYAHPNDPRHEEADPNFRGFGRAETRKDGRFQLRTIKPGSRDGQAPFINVRVFARGMLIHAFTRIYFADEDANRLDPLLQTVDPARVETLIAQKEGSHSTPVYQFDIHLQGDNETVFFDS